jgi:hypothetical protein
MHSQLEMPNTHLRILKLLILLSFFLCYLEWGQGHHGFLYQLAWSVFTMQENATSFLHPFIFIPLGGVLAMAISSASPGKARRLTIVAIAMMSMLVLLILLVGILAPNIKIILSTVPFLFTSVVYLVAATREKHRTSP